MNRRHFALILAPPVLCRRPGIADAMTDGIVDQLRRRAIAISTSAAPCSAGCRIVAVSPKHHREIIFNPRTGEILRDYPETADGEEEGPEIYDPDKAEGSGSGHDDAGGGSGDGGSGDGGSGGGGSGGGGSDGGRRRRQGSGGGGSGDGGSGGGGSGGGGSGGDSGSSEHEDMSGDSADSEDHGGSDDGQSDDGQDN